jgi:hypothetical protein
MDPNSTSARVQLESSCHFDIVGMEIRCPFSPFDLLSAETIIMARTRGFEPLD